MKIQISTLSKKIAKRLSVPLVLLLAVICNSATTELKAQTVTYSQTHTNGQTATAQCAAWGVFQTQLTPGNYHTMRIWGSNDMTGLTCTDFTTVNAMAAAIKNATTYISGTVNGHVWSVCNRYNGETWIDPPSSCSGSNCPSPGYILRPCITNLNWGGVNTATCGAPTQLMAIEFIAGPPCPVPTNLTITAVYSGAVFFSWTPPTGSNGAEFVVDQNATGPTGTPAPTITTNSSASQAGLTPSTNYYLHVRNRCDSPGKSQWVTTSFTTLPPCVLNPSVSVPQIDTNSATITWQSITPAVEYQYFIKKDKSAPTSGAGSTSTTSNQINLSSLDPGQVYYIYLRAKCLGGDSSSWILDSFYVPIPCRAPDVKFNDVNSNRVVAYWTAPLTAYEYDIVNASSQLTPPITGTKQVNNSYLFPYLDDNKTYYVYTRSYCNDKGIHSISPWAEATYKTWALGISEVEDEVNSLKVYPNPVQDEMVVTITGKTTKDGVVSVLDVSGKVLKTLLADKKEIRINIGQLPAGVYMVQYADDARREQVRFNKK